MKRNTRKGFTGIELVIVIAIIAILAASLIPAFGGLIDGANKTADLQGAREMDAAIKMGALGKTIDLQQAIEILDEAGFDITSLDPLYKKHEFRWSDKAQSIYLYDTKAEKVTYPDGQLGMPDDAQLLLDGACYFVTEVNSADAFYAAIENGTSIKLTDNITVEKLGNLSFSGEDVELDLNGRTLNLPIYNNGTVDRHDYVEVTAGKLTIVGGVINARGVQAYDGAELVIEGTKINAVDTDAGAGIFVWAGATVTVKDAEIVVANNAGTKADGSAHNGACGIINKGGTVTVENCTVSSVHEQVPYVLNNQSGTMIINSGNFSSYSGLVAAISGEVIINGGTFTWNNEPTGDSQYMFYTSGSGKITFNDGVIVANNNDTDPILGGTKAFNDVNGKYDLNGTTVVEK